MWIGLLLVCIGILVLLNNMDILRGDVWNYIWPLVLIFIGVSLIFKRSRRERWNRFTDRHKDRPPDRSDTPQT